MTEHDIYQNTLVDWQTDNYFREKPDIMLTTACDSLRTEETALVYPKEGAGGRWMYYDKATEKPAVFTHAGIWLHSHDLETGNYVPAGQQVPEGLPSWQVRHELTTMSEFAYTIDVSSDKSMLNHMQTLEMVLCRQPSFNKAGRPRKEWQNYQTEITKYTFAHKMFTKRSARLYQKPRKEELEGLHPWLVDGINKLSDKTLKFNGPIPKHLEHRGNSKLVPIQECSPPTFLAGDIVWFSFRMGFYIGSQNWAPELMPIEFVRVAKSDGLPSLPVPVVEWPALDPDVKVLSAGKGVRMLSKKARFAETVTDAKGSKQSSSDNEDTLSSDDASSQHSAASIKRRLAESKQVTVTEEGKGKQTKRKSTKGK